MTYQELLELGTKSLEQAQENDAELDAWYLLEYVSGMQRAAYYLHMKEEAEADLVTRYRELIERRQAHEPLQYITGHQEFMGLDFCVTPAVLIPRQDTETLVEQVQDRLQEGDRILDICTGSGCILISLLHAKPGCRGTGVDISPEALAVAQENASRLQVEADWMCSDLFAGVTGQYDIIVSNPPYIATAELQTLMPEVIRHEPVGALDGQEDGLHFYQSICAEAPAHLSVGGWLFFEIGYDQAEAVSQLMREAGFGEIAVIQDYCGKDRVVKGCL